MTEVIKVDVARPSPVALAQAAEVLAGGGLVVFPTETFYGIAADIDQAKALERLVALKGRDPHNPIGLIMPYSDTLNEVANEVPRTAWQLMAQHWPGPLTLVMTAKFGLHPLLVSASGGVGVRESPHKVARGLARALGGPITATSANLTGGQSVARVKSLNPAIAEGVDLILDAGVCKGTLASTVVDCTVDPPEVLRSGAIIISL